ncbi:MAG: zinc ABC transporter substrate-binding protein [Rhodobacteraceae bacterium]|nr:zinc ABC transporter substrate-binding protein [Paracoccaceae bacterium]
MRYIISFFLTSLIFTSAYAEVPDVVTDIPPVHALVSRVMGDLGTPTLLLTKGVSEHDLQLHPLQAVALADAELVVWIGPELTPWLDRVLSRLVSAKNLVLLDAPETARRAFSEDGAHVHGGHDDYAVKGKVDFVDHSRHEGTDPHAWLDPTIAKAWLPLIAAALSALDRENATTYVANATKAQADIDALDAHVTALLAPVKDRPVVVYHDAYGYFANHFGLSIKGSIALGDATLPGAAKLAALQDTLAIGETTCIFPEAQHDKALAEQLAVSTKMKLGAPLDPVGSTLTAGPNAYDALLTKLATSITECFIVP